MKYVNVAIPDKDYEPKNVILTGNTLASLYELMDEKRFGLMGASHDARKKTLMDYSQNVVKANGAELYIDSGGYSIIGGQVPFEHIEEFQEYYFHFLEHEVDNYDYIFSLDIPWGADEERLQNKDILYNANYRLMSKTIKLMEKNPALRDKFYFVYHFKLMDQYDIWRKMYEELELGKHIIHRAIGGLVGLKRAVGGLDFTSFLPMIFRVFQDFLDSGQEPRELRIHILGVSTFYERLAITLAEEIIYFYLRDNSKIKTEVVFTYDSTSYAHQAWKRFKTMPFWHFDGSLAKYAYHDVPNGVLQDVYGTGDTLLKIRDEINRANNNQRLKNANAFIPLSIHSQMQLDDFLAVIAYSYNLVDATKTGGSRTKIEKSEAKEALNDLKTNFKRYENELFTKQIVGRIENDLMILSFLRHCLFNGKMTKIEDMVRTIIRLINHPDYLK